MTFSQASDYALDHGCPEDELDAVLDGINLCGRCGSDGPCADDERGQIDAAIRELK